MPVKKAWNSKNAPTAATVEASETQNSPEKEFQMNDITSASVVKQQSLTMTSREIAELCQKEHKNVMADIRRMLEDIGESSANFLADLPDTYGRKQPVFVLPKDLTLTLVSGYSVVMRKRIIDRWLELESKSRAAPWSPLQLSRLELLEMAMQAEQDRIALERKVDTLQPKAEALDRIATGSDGSMCIRDAAKTLQMQEGKLTKFLVEHKWLYQRPMGSGKLAYSEKIQGGLLEHKVTKGEKSDGSEWVSTQARVTARGLAKLAEMLGSTEVAA